MLLVLTFLNLAIFVAYSFLNAIYLNNSPSSFISYVTHMFSIAFGLYLSDSTASCILPKYRMRRIKYITYSHLINSMVSFVSLFFWPSFDNRRSDDFDVGVKFFVSSGLTSTVMLFVITTYTIRKYDGYRMSYFAR